MYRSIVSALVVVALVMPAFAAAPTRRYPLGRSGNIPPAVTQPPASTPAAMQKGYTVAEFRAKLQAERAFADKFYKGNVEMASITASAVEKLKKSNKVTVTFPKFDKNGNKTGTYKVTYTKKDVANLRAMIGKDGKYTKLKDQYLKQRNEADAALKRLG